MLHSSESNLANNSRKNLNSSKIHYILSNGPRQMRLPPFKRENYEVSESHIIFLFLCNIYCKNWIFSHLIPVKLTIIVNTMSYQHSVYSRTAFSYVCRQHQFYLCIYEQGHIYGKGDLSCLQHCDLVVKFWTLSGIIACPRSNKPSKRICPLESPWKYL